MTYGEPEARADLHDVYLPKAADVWWESYNINLAARPCDAIKSDPEAVREELGRLLDGGM